ncbi:MAG: CoA-binding protein [Acidobacteria bacterium]|nr:CoA-binding protein [Acidobacteriota bacterium]
MTSGTALEGFLAERSLALVGASRSSKKFGNLALRELRTKGYRVYPIHPSAHTIDGVQCYSRFADLPEIVDAALVIVPPGAAVSVVRDAAAAGIHHVWLQQGAESPEALKVCRELGMDVVSEQCILMFAHPTGYHKVHRWLWRLLRKLPAAPES